jgi:type IV pilus assembly protein PilB
MVDMGVDPFLVASSVSCVCAQRLGRKLCEACKRPMDALPPSERLLSLGFLEEDLESAQLWEPVGCARCDNKGYRGRFALLETLPLNEESRRLIIEGGSALDLKALARKQGMITLRRCGVLNAMRVRTSLDEILTVTIGDE